MSAFRATYYTGKSSQGYHAVVSLRGDFLLISYLSDGDEPVFVEWALKEIKKMTSAGSAATYQYGSFPFQSISTSDAALIDLLDQQSNSFEQHYGRLLNGGWETRIALAGLFMGLVAVFYFFIVPGTAAFLAGQLPQQVEIDLGEKLYESVKNDFVEDKRLSGLANEFAAQLNFDTDYPIQITVVRQDEMNAFAMPGGHIVVYNELLDELESPEAFAALLGHEVAHIKHRHSLKSISRTLSSYLFVSLVLGDLNGVSAIFVEHADALVRLSYSRELEQAADQEALDVLARNRLDQQGLVQLMQALQDAHEHEPIRLLSSHPLTQDRIDYARARIKQDRAPLQKEALQEIWEKMKEGEE